jgi:hypothetical protein
MPRLHPHKSASKTWNIERAGDFRVYTIAGKRIQAEYAVADKRPQASSFNQFYPASLSGACFSF